MAPSLSNPKYKLFSAFYFLLFLQTEVLCIQYKVGDLDAWGIPTSSNPKVYSNWSKNHHFQIGDSLLFLYPPSQDSVIQVTEQAFNACNISDPILYMNDGNSLFNFTTLGTFYFTSGVPGQCEKSQKLEVSVISADGSSFPPSNAPAASPSFANVFGSIPTTSSSPALKSFLGLVVVAIVSAIVILLS